MMGSKRKRKRIGPMFNVQTWPTCGDCEREVNPEMDEIYPGDDTFLFGWRCRCGSVSYTAVVNEVSHAPVCVPWSKED